MNQSYYKILGINEDASHTQIEQAYKRTINTYSDDVAMYSIASPEECENILKEAEKAFFILSDEEKRQQYDEAHGLNKFANKLSAQKEVTKPTPINKGYELDFKTNQEFEEEIANTTIFTGELLKRILEYKGMSIEQMADLTKISKTNLRGIEAEKFDRTPADVYLRSFAYQYAKTLRLDPDLVGRSYLEHFKSKA